MENLKNGLKKLGVKGKATAYPMENDSRILVLLNNKYFGVWDMSKDTFID